MRSQTDVDFMTRALQLAVMGQYTTAPNPAVGCVIVKDGLVVGEGFHQQAGGPHAEVFALRQAAEKACGATAYVTLEPCSHYGRTPPCANALIEAGINRVVAAMLDPNPQVAGQGIQRLQEAGICTEVGVLQQQAQALNPEFFFRMHHQRPMMRLKLAASLDGGIALANGESQWLTGPEARRDVQLWRARSCAILSTAQTVKADQATLTVRLDDVPNLANGAKRQPLRVILDRRCRLTGNEPLFQTGGDIVLMHCGEPSSWPELERTNTDRQVQRVRIGLDAVGQLDITELLRWLAKQKLNSIWVEAGATLASSLWQADCVDEFIVYQAPLLLGVGAMPLLNVAAPSTLNAAKRWRWQEAKLLGADVRLHAKLFATLFPKD